MFTEFLKLKPIVDPTALNRLIKTLNQRFLGVARTFGRGLTSALKFAPWAIGAAVLAKLVNPLKEAQEILDRMLNKGDDAVTFAEEFGTDPGKLLRLEAIAASKGLESETLRKMLLAFQGELAKERDNAKNRPKEEPGLLRNFIGEKDTAEAFFKFIQALQQQDKTQQTIAQELIFGEKVRGKASEFLNAKNFADILKKLPTAEALSRAAVKTGEISDQNDLLRAVRDSQDFVNKSSIINNSMITAIDGAERARQKNEDESLKRFDDLKEISKATQELTNRFNQFATDFIQVTAPKVVEGIDLLKENVDKLLKWAAGFSVKLETWFNQLKESRIFKYFGK